MLRRWIYVVFALCACTDVTDDGETEADVAAQQQFIDDITPDVAGEVAAQDGDDRIDDIAAMPPPATETFARGTYHNALVDDHGHPLTCPDPSVDDASTGGYRYVLVCTSDYDRNSFPIRKSNDLVHWKNVGYVFADGQHPAWARPIDAGGRYWAPEIFRIGGTWVVYFATKRKGDGQMVIGVASSPTLRGRWASHILHHSGEFNSVNPHHELSGGVIDPSVLRGADGKLYLYYAKQSNQIWVGKLSDDGMKLASDIDFLFGVTFPWEVGDSGGSGCIEGPEPFINDGKYYLMYSGASTWDGTYAIGVAVSDSPTGPFSKKTTPILHRGRGFISPGHSSHPVRGPDGNLYLLYHALRTPSHVSNDRKLMLDRFNWSGAWPLVHDGEPSSGDKEIP